MLSSHKLPFSWGHVQWRPSSSRTRRFRATSRGTWSSASAGPEGGYIAHCGSSQIIRSDRVVGFCHMALHKPSRCSWCLKAPVFGKDGLHSGGIFRNRKVKGMICFAIMTCATSTASKILGSTLHYKVSTSVAYVMSNSVHA